MERLVRHLLLFLFVCSGGYLPGQADTSVLLPQVIIPGNVQHASNTIARSETYRDSAIAGSLNTDLGGFLQGQSSLYVKTYGSGSIASPTVRGSNAGQVLLLWNGLPIQNAMLGQSDLSLIQPRLFEAISIERGGNSALHGTGAMGGTFEMSSNAALGQGLQAGITLDAGSFGYLFQNADVHYSNDRITTETRLYNTSAKNDFEYVISPDLPTNTQEHARFRQKGVLQSIGVRTGASSVLSGHFWWSETDREIPPTLVQTKSEATQYDRSSRYLLEWKTAGRTGVLSLKAAYMNEGQIFSDPRSGAFSDSQVDNLLGTAEYAKQFKDFSLSAGVQYISTSATTDAYKQTRTQNRAAVYVLTKYDPSNPWAFEMNLRQPVIDGEASPFVFHVNSSYSLSPLVELYARFGRDFRAPGLNDRFWKPGGNPDLQPETSWGGETGISGQSNPGNWSLRYGLSGYARFTENWIIWSPVEGQGYWGAHNLSEVFSRGLESRLGTGISFGKCAAYLDGQYDFTVSTNEIAITTPTIGAGQQLIYTPKHNGFTTLGFTWKGLTIQYRQRFTSEVNTEAGTTLAGYSYGDFHIRSGFSINSISITLRGEMNNAWNKNYQVILNRPMPGRNFNLGLTIQFYQDKPNQGHVFKIN